MLTYDDFDGVYFTVQSLRLHHPEAMEQVEFLILDNHSEGAHGKAVKDLTGWVRQPVRYIPVAGRERPCERLSLSTHKLRTSCAWTRM